ncbi:MAG: 3-methyl-2-oxobutanoate hydroxymethyltransferase [Methylocella sp.]
MSKAARFFDMKRRGTKIAVLTAYDAPTARAEAEAGVDIILVGDSVGANMLGYKSEREVTLADMRHHIAAVRRGAPEATIIGDLPFQTYDSPAAAVANAKELVAAGANIVKFEGAHLAILEALAAAAIEVCCHLGLEPQTHLEKRVKGRSAQEAAKLLADAMALDQAGMKLLILEMIPEEVAAEVTRSVKAPTIGIGAGRKTDGQVLVITDVLGFGAKNFRHNRRYAEVGALMVETARAYARDVRGGAFPAEENLTHMAPEDLALFLRRNP